MAIVAELKENRKVDKSKINNAISSLKKSMTDYKTERKSDWKLFKSKFQDDMDKVEKSFKKLAESTLKQKNNLRKNRKDLP